MKDIYELELHEHTETRMRYGLRHKIMRVPGGWIYQGIIRTIKGKDEYQTPCFVPFDNEFLPQNTAQAEGK